MAEFVEVMKQKARMCESYHCCSDCGLHHERNGTDMDCRDFITHKAKEAEKIIAEWAAEHSEPKYPSWDVAWNQLFPDAQHPDAPCLKYMLPNNHPQMCGVHCHECSKRPIPADIAERLGIKPLEG